nr:uncharacterized protein LOC104117440 [Nicotiana tomentosiformis]
MDSLTQHIKGEVPWCLLFAQDIVLIDETRGGVNDRLEVWRHTLESKVFKLSRTKTEYLKCKFSGITQEADGYVRLDMQAIPRRESFKYLGSIIQKDGEIDKDVTHQCWPVKNSHVQQMKVAEMRMLRWMCEHTRLDRIRNEVIWDNVGVVPMEAKMCEARLRWFGHVKRRSTDAPVRRCERLALGVEDDIAASVDFKNLELPVPGVWSYSAAMHLHYHLVNSKKKLGTSIP